MWIYVGIDDIHACASKNENVLHMVIVSIICVCFFVILLFECITAAPLFKDDLRIFMALFLLHVFNYGSYFMQFVWMCRWHWFNKTFVHLFVINLVTLLYHCSLNVKMKFFVYDDNRGTCILQGFMYIYKYSQLSISRSCGDYFSQIQITRSAN